MIFLLGLMVLGLAVLAGGQIWAISGSTSLAWTAGLLVFILLTWLVRGRSKRRRGTSFLGEVEEHFEEGEFSTLVPGQNNHQRERVQKQVMSQTAQAAHSIRSMLRDKKSGKSGGS